jgi:2-oxo-4-hydroxy-4-carboxy-5-ureidoimidazoline decarboxylase
MTIAELNSLDPGALRESLGRCCGAGAWIEKMLSVFPVSGKDVVFAEAEKVWYSCAEKDWREAFDHHPRIGDLEGLKKKFAATGQWAAGEQAGVQDASEKVLEELASGNKAYEEKFGYIFIVCATGLPAASMLSQLEERLGNSPELEILIAMGEQNKITRIRLEKLLS